jgi:predicted DCC family thiol-disulfide oxidoreductase YuxK
MQAYRKRNPQDRLRFIDISAADFSADAYGKTQDEFMAQMHVRDASGDFTTGIDAFSVIWQAYPSGSIYRLFSALIGFPGINLFSRFGYAVFARYRHLLPKKYSNCDSDHCNLNHPR